MRHGMDRQEFESRRTGPVPSGTGVMQDPGTPTANHTVRGTLELKGRRTGIAPFVTGAVSGAEKVTPFDTVRGTGGGRDPRSGGVRGMGRLEN